MADNGKIIRNGAEIQIDENGNVVARPADGQEFIVEDDAVVGSLEAEEATLRQATFGEDVVFSIAGGSNLSEVPANTTSTTFEEVAELSGIIVGGENVPEGLTLYGKMNIRASVTEGETAIVRPSFRKAGSLTGVRPSELELEITESVTDQYSTGWQPISSENIRSDNFWKGRALEAEVTGGELTMSGEKSRHGIAFQWRLD